MKILLAPDSFKSSLSSKKICSILSDELKKLILDSEIISLPFSDGGEGSLEVISGILNAEEITTRVSDPFGQPINASYLFDKDNKTVHIESAKSYGLNLFAPKKKNCIKASSFGTGELIKHAAGRGAKKIIIYLGGSSGNDGGTGLANALGYKFINHKNEELKGTGENLIHINRIDDSGYIFRNSNIKFVAGCDVNNPFYGPDGATLVYAAQKGASPGEIKTLETGMQNLADLILKKYNVNLQNISGVGSAGGLGGGVLAFLNAELRSGADIIAEITRIEELINVSDLIITGEGKIDSQTVNDKLVKNISARAKKYSVPVWVVCGYFEGDELLKNKLGIQKIFTLAKTRDEIKESIIDPELYLKNTSKIIANDLACIIHAEDKRQK